MSAELVFAWIGFAVCAGIALLVVWSVLDDTLIRPPTTLHCTRAYCTYTVRRIRRLRFWWHRRRSCPNHPQRPARLSSEEQA